MRSKRKSPLVGRCAMHKQGKRCLSKSFADSPFIKDENKHFVIMLLTTYLTLVILLSTILIKL